MQSSKYNRILTLLPLAATLLLGGCNWGVLDPQGPIGEDERSLIVEATLLAMGCSYAWWRGEKKIWAGRDGF
jgi:cytochrome o ubiquinol oxidase subunit II